MPVLRTIDLSVNEDAPKKKSPTPTQVLVVTSVMFTFISYWRTAAIVLCDLASTAYYIGGIVESQIGPAAPWFILAVMVFSYAVRSVYIESCSMFVRGGVYRIVKEALGGGPGPARRLGADVRLHPDRPDQRRLGRPIHHRPARRPARPRARQHTMPIGTGSAAIAVVVTLYFWRVNIRGIHESSDKALKIMGATTIMGVIMIVWCLATLAVHPEKAKLPTAMPDLSKKVDVEGKPIPDALGQQVDPIGFLGQTQVGEAPPARDQVNWLSLIGVLGIVVAFGHSILAMSGEETLAQVYREVESPKLQNFKKAAFIVFIYSLLLTSLISFFAVMIIPDDVPDRANTPGNLIGGLAMSVVGPHWAKLGAQCPGRRSSAS